jgi:hypothetical protein
MFMNEVWGALVDAGVEMVSVDARHIEVHHGRDTARLLLKSYSHPITPSDAARIFERHREPGVVVVPTATTQVRRAVEQAGWSWLVMGPGGVHGTLRLAGSDVRIGDETSEEHPPRRRKSGPVPWGSLTVMRCLIEQPTVTQQALATMARVSQPRVSQTLTTLAEQNLVRRVDRRWAPSDLDGLLRLWLETYPGPGGISTHWFGLDPPTSQAHAVMGLLSETKATKRGARRERGAAAGEPLALLSGDVAADLIAPWRSPTRATIYARAGMDLADVGLTPVGAQEATLELIVPRRCASGPLGR